MQRTVEPDEDPVDAPIPTDGERCTCGELLDWNDQKGILDCPKCTPFQEQKTK